MNTPTVSGTPTGKRVLVFPDEQERVSKGGIIIPEEAKKNARTGIIVQIGDEVEKLKPYQPVLFGEYSGSTMDFEEGRFILMFESDIMYAWPVVEPPAEQKTDPVEETKPVSKKSRKGATVIG
jgi:chaperonin GroES